MKDFERRTVLVTGAASGIGRETALAFAREGADLVLCDVSVGPLAEAVEHVERAARPGARVTSHRVDVARRDEMERFATEVHRTVQAVDVLVNNAGVGLAGGFLDTSLDDWEWIVRVNLWGVIHGCHFFTPRMVERGQGGHVVNVASAAGFFNSQAMAAYGTTKYGVVGLSEALREELVTHRIGVSTICPGLIRTPMIDTMPLRGSRFAAGARERIVRLYERRNYGPDKVARAIVDAVRHGRGLVPVAPEAWAMYLTKRAFPSLVPALLELAGKRWGRGG